MDNGEGGHVADAGTVLDGEWHTVTYDISSDRKHNDFAAANMPLDSATGNLYFFVGLSGQSGGYITQYIKNVTLVHKDGAANNIVSKGSGFGVPSFISYGNLENKSEWVILP
jgi:hypothetical protein